MWKWKYLPILSLLACSPETETMDPYVWFQGEWISDPGMSMASNPQFDLLDPDAYVEVRAMYGNARWSISNDQMRYSEQNSENASETNFEIEAIDESSFRYTDSWGGRLLIRRSRDGFCMHTDTLLQLENISECFLPFDAKASAGLDHGEL